MTAGGNAAHPVPQQSAAGVCTYMDRYIDELVTMQAVLEANERIRKYIDKTPVVTSLNLDERLGKELFFKCELYQRTGSFKLRGALNAMLRLVEIRQDEDDDFTVVAYSSGNHGAGVSMAANLLGLKAKVVVPVTAPAVKKAAIRHNGGEVIDCKPSLQIQRQTVADLMLELGRGGEYIPPSDHPFVMAGQGSVALELLEQVPHLDAIVAPAGGGGLVSSICLVAKTIKPTIKVFAAKPSKSKDLLMSFTAKKRITMPDFSDTIADGLRNNISLRCWPLILEKLDDVISVTDDQIADAMAVAWTTMKLSLEPSGAAAMAAVLSDEFKVKAGGLQRVAVVLSGGNVDADLFARLTAGRTNGHSVMKHDEAG